MGNSLTAIYATPINVIAGAAANAYITNNFDVQQNVQLAMGSGALTLITMTALGMWPSKDIPQAKDRIQEYGFPLAGASAAAGAYLAANYIVNRPEIAMKSAAVFGAVTFGLLASGIDHKIVHRFIVRQERS